MTYESPYDRLLSQFPPPRLISHAIIRERTADYERLFGAASAAQQELGRLNTEHTRALHREDAARTNAVREGKPDPGTKASDKLARDVAAQELAVDAHLRARDQARAEMADAIEEHRVEWQGAIDDDLAAARERYLAAVEALADAHADMAATANVRSWAATFPNSKWAPIGFMRRLDRLPARGGEAVDIETALDALRELGTPPAPPARPAQQHVPPGGMQSGAVPRPRRIAKLEVGGENGTFGWVD